MRSASSLGKKSHERCQEEVGTPTTQQDEDQGDRQVKLRYGACYNCVKKEHFTRDCRSKRRPVEENAATSNSYQENNEEEWDAKASVTVVEEAFVKKVNDMTLTSIVVETEHTLAAVSNRE